MVSVSIVGGAGDGGGGFGFVPATVGGPSAGDAAPAESVEAAAEEEEDPGDEGEPDSAADGGGSAWDLVDAGSGDEEEGNVEYESDEGDDCGETGYAGAETGHGHLADVGEKTEEGRASCEHKGDDVEKEGVGEPFDDDLGDAYGQTVAH